MHSVWGLPSMSGAALSFIWRLSICEHTLKYPVPGTEGLQTDCAPFSSQLNDKESYFRSSVGIRVCVCCIVFFFLPSQNHVLLHPSFDFRQKPPPNQLLETLWHKARQVTDEIKGSFSGKWICHVVFFFLHVWFTQHKGGRVLIEWIWVQHACSGCTTWMEGITKGKQNNISRLKVSVSRPPWRTQADGALCQRKRLVRGWTASGVLCAAPQSLWRLQKKKKKCSGWPLTHAAINYYPRPSSVPNKERDTDEKHFHGRSESKWFQSKWIYDRCCVSGIQCSIRMQTV